MLCAAEGPERLAALKRAATGVHWELVGGAASARELEHQLSEWTPDVVVADTDLAIEPGRVLHPVVRVAAKDGRFAKDTVHAAILAGPLPGGPVRT